MAPLYDQLIMSSAGVAFVFHTLSMLTKGAFQLDGNDSKSQAIEGLLITAFVVYGLMVLLSLLVNYAEFRHPVFKFVCAGLAVLGALFAMIGLGIFDAATENSYNNGRIYGAAVYVAGAVAAIFGALVCVFAYFVVDRTAGTPPPFQNIETPTPPATA